MKIGGYHDRCLGESLTDIAEWPVKGQVLQTWTCSFLKLRRHCHWYASSTFAICPEPRLPDELLVLCP